MIKKQKSLFEQKKLNFKSKICDLSLEKLQKKPIFLNNLKMFNTSLSWFEFFLSIILA